LAPAKRLTALAFVAATVALSAPSSATVLFSPPVLPPGGIQYGPDEYSYNTIASGPVSVPGFTFDGFSGVLENTTYLPQPVPVGSQAAFLQTDYQSRPIGPGSQGSGQLGGSIDWTIPALAGGTTYTLSFFDVAINTVPADPITVSACGGTPVTFTPTSLWTAQSYTFTDPLSCDTIDFTGTIGSTGSNEASAFTDLSLNVPEPLTLSLFGAGLAGAVALRRRKMRTRQSDQQAS
jgi:hypothetical protein